MNTNNPEPIIKIVIPPNAPLNPYTIGTQQWADWITYNRDNSTNPIVLVQTKPVFHISSIPYEFIREYQNPIGRGDMYWFFLSDVTSIKPQEAPPIIEADKLTPALKEELGSILDDLRATQSRFTAGADDLQDFINHYSIVN